MIATRETKHIEFETKDITDDGQFTGFAAVYGNVDLGGDVIERGAFRKTLAERQLRAPVFHEHKYAVGSATLEDTEFGLKTIGKFNLDKQSAREAYSDLKFYKAEGIRMGMSIGYMPVGERPSFRDDGARVLKELKIFEVTLTLTPMNERAGVTEVKAYPGRLDQILDQWDELREELKSGRKISKERADRLRTAANEILSLLSEAGADEATTSEGADGKSGGPVIDHAKLTQSIQEIRGALAWKN
jgi:HK97 family phage prohead protease